MLKGFKNQESVVIIFFVVVLICVGIFAFFEKSVIDTVYFMLMMVFFMRFLRLKYSGGR